ncbi:MAG: hypothetical protein RLZZ31_732 [Actinomycetota bacterium]
MGEGRCSRHSVSRSNSNWGDFLSQTVRVNLAERVDDNKKSAVAIQATNLTLAYGHHRVLDNASFTLPSGAITTLVGPNGAGKSTLLDAVANLLPPQSGQLRIFGETPAQAQANVAYVLQSAKVNDALPLSVREVVTMGRYPRRGMFSLLTNQDRQFVDDAIERLEITDLVSRHIWELSGGQRQRVFLAQGLAQQADVLLLDEPVTGLDVVSRQRILDVVQQEKEIGRTIVMTTHDLADAAASDFVLLMAGRIVDAGAPETVLTADNLTAAYGGRILRLADGIVLIDDPHHHAHGHDHALCDDDDEMPKP